MRNVRFKRVRPAADDLEPACADLEEIEDAVHLGIDADDQRAQGVEPVQPGTRLPGRRRLLFPAIGEAAHG